jgi:hypothetical protein
MMKNKWTMVGLAVVLSVMAIGVWTGCESAGGTGGVSVSPANPVLGGASSNSTAVVFTASVSDQLALPLAWSVSNPALGTIISASGSNATYKANVGVTGDNIVTVKDQYDNQGSAVVTQN